MKSLAESLAHNFDDAEPSVCPTPTEVERPLLEMHVTDKASTLFGSSEVRQQDERNVFSDILEGIAQKEREAKEREKDGEVNQPLPGLWPPSTRGIDEVDGKIVEGEEEINSLSSLNEWVAHMG